MLMKTIYTCTLIFWPTFCILSFGWISSLAYEGDQLSFLYTIFFLLSSHLVIDSSDSEDEVSVVPQPESEPGDHKKEHSSSEPPPPLPPRTASMSKEIPNEGRKEFTQSLHGPVLDQFPIHEEITFDKDKQAACLESRMEAQKRAERTGNVLRESMSPRSSPRRKKKKVPPPKPPRTDLMMNGSDLEQDEIHSVIRRVSSIVDFTTQQLTDVAAHNSLTRRPFTPLSPADEVMPPIPKPRLIRRRSKSSDAILKQRPTSPMTAVAKPTPPVKISKDTYVSRNRSGSADVGKKIDGRAHVSRNRLGSADVSKESKRGGISRQTRASSTKVSSLIQMFESKSPTSSPKARKRQFQKWTPPSPRRRAYAVRDMSPDPPDFLSQMGLPLRPPKTKLSAPPVPPKPPNSSKIEPPVVPPRTPVPLLPPKPPGSKPPSVLPRLGHRRSLSDSTSLTREEIPPKIPPK